MLLRRTSAVFLYSFRLWSCVFTVICLPFDLIYRLDSFIKYLSFLDIATDTSVMVFLFLTLSLFAAIASVMVFPALCLLSGERAEGIILWVNNILALTISAVVIGKVSKFWINKFVLFYSPFAYKYMIILLLFISIVLGIFFKNAIRSKLQDISLNLFRSVKIAVLISIILIGVKIFLITINSENAFATKDMSIAKNGLNVILITFDALTAEDMPLYGYQRDTSPHLRAFARESYVFENMFANCNCTPSSVSSILTSKYPSVHKVYNFNYHIPDRIKHENIAHILEINGYQTSAIISYLCAHPWTNGLYSDFDYLSPITYYKNEYYHYIMGASTGYFFRFNINAHHWTAGLINTYFPFLIDYYLSKFWPGEIANPPELTFNIAREHIQKSKQPFFIWVHVFPPHNPYLPDKRAKYVFLKENILEDRGSQIPAGTFYTIGQQPIIDKHRLRYNEHILYADFEFNNFLIFLKQEGLYENSIIIVSADHGEMFEKGFIGHCGDYLYQPAIHVPLVIHMPNQRYGKRILNYAEQIDIAPTILDLLGLDIPHWMEGESLKKAMEGNYVSNKPKFSMNLEKNFAYRRITQGTIAVIKDDYKYIHYVKENKGELYNLKKDPEELNNLAEFEKEKASELKKLIFDRIIKSSLN